jgi:tRNA(fMet)-specific endonuclease VapC
MKYLLDTNICIYLIKKKPVSVVDNLLQMKPGEIGISSITIVELEYGVQKSKQIKKNQEALEYFIAPFEVVVFDSNAAIEYGVIRADLERKGKPIGAYDLLIAAQARDHGLILVTNNTKEFQRIPDLLIENWVK